ncbi:MAG TPA: metallophosphoesterase family protein, partial [Candidatus Limnocylindria bacterium]|nr:metallophosphoesterase family protein [Candidatus Limnocylindria bacterium]
LVHHVHASEATLVLPSTYQTIPADSPLRPKFRTLSGFAAHHAECIKKGVATVPLQELLSTLHKFAKQTEQRLLQSDTWVANAPDQRFFDLTAARKFQPYVQKRIVPPGSKIITFGDLHGQSDAVIKLFEDAKNMGIIDDNLKILQPHVYFHFLGDFVDRGKYGTEVLYLLLRFYIANPDHVTLIRGNHEDADLNASFGFEQELVRNYDIKATQLHKNTIYRLYDLLPVAIYTGAGTQELSYSLGCHGGHEIGYDAFTFLHRTPATKQFTWVGTLQRADACHALPPHLQQAIERVIPEHQRMNFTPQSPCRPCGLGFMWSDFNPKDGKDGEKTDYMEGRGWVYGQELTRYLMHKAGIKVIFRAHQHHGPMLEKLCQNKGMVKLWDGMVYTLLSTPVVAHFPYRSLCAVTTSDTSAGWQVQLHTRPMHQPQSHLA